MSGRRHDHRNYHVPLAQHGRPPPFDYVHPLLRELLDRMGAMPPGDPEELSEGTLARAIYFAIEMTDDFEQASILSRIIPDEELARERLARPDVRDIHRHIFLSPIERRVALRNSPEPEEDLEAADLGDCVVCGDTGTVRMRCSCIYCLPCLRRLVRLGLSSEVEFPPRCCNIPLTETMVQLTRRPELVHLFRQLAAEAAVPANQRLYCHDGNCATFIPPPRHGVCPVCRLATCTDCQGPQHRHGRRCHVGTEVENVWQTMDRNNVVNCPGCGRMVQLWDGCNHMTWVNSLPSRQGNQS